MLNSMYKSSAADSFKITFNISLFFHLEGLSKNHVFGFFSVFKAPKCKK